MEVGVSIVIPFMEYSSLLVESVQSCLRLTHSGFLKEIILMHNGNKDYMNMPGINDKRIRIAHIDRQNLCSARNYGAFLAKGEIILSTDSDCIVDARWADELVRCLVDSKAAAIVGRIKAYKPTTEWELLAEDTFSWRTRELDYIIGGNCAIQKNIFQEIGGYDENLSVGGDLDLGLRLSKAGYKIIYAPGALVYHKHMSNLKNIAGQYIKYGRGWRQLKKKWGVSLKMYPNLKRVFISLCFISASGVYFTFYILTRRNKFKTIYLKNIYLAIVNISLVIGYFKD